MMQRWAGGGRDAPLPVIAPEGVTAIVDGLNAAYAADAQYRIASTRREPCRPLRWRGVGALLYIPLSTFCTIFSGMALSHIYDGT